MAALVCAGALGVPSMAAAAAPAAPKLAGPAITDPVNLSGATAVAVSGQYGYVTAYNANELTAINFQNPAHPFIAGESLPTAPPSTTLMNGSTVNVSGGYAFVVSKNANGPSGSGSNDNGTGNALTILDIATDPAHPAVIGSLTDSLHLFGAYGVAVYGTYAYVAAQGCLTVSGPNGQPCPNQSVGNSFEVIDISNPQHPTIVKTLHYGSAPQNKYLQHATSVAISSDGKYAYVTAMYSSSLTVVDISNPTSASVVWSKQDTVNTPDPVDVALQGNYAYVVSQTNNQNELAVYNVQNPASPVPVGELNSRLLNGAYRIRVRGTMAYIAASGANAIEVVDISDPTHPQLLGNGYLSTATLAHTTGLDLDPTGRYVIATSPYLSTENQTRYPPYPLQTGGPTNTGTVNVIDLDPASISVSLTAEPANPTPQTTANFAFTLSDQVATTTCTLDGVSGLCTTPSSAQYLGLLPGSHTFTVRASDSAGQISSTSYTWTVSGSGLPVNSVPPSISGNATLGSTLTVDPGQWSGSPTFAYHWQDCNAAGTSCSPITGATSSTYTLTSADVGSAVEVIVTATNGSGSTPATSDLTAVVVAPPVNSAAPSITGSATKGSTLTVNNGTWSGAPSFTYQWQDCNAAGASCTAIAGATASGYVLTSADAGSTVEVVVTATNSAGTATATSAPTAVVTDPPVNTGLPTVSGSATQGSTLTATSGTWSGTPAPAFTYAWQDCDNTGANCSTISGATGPGYTLTAADVGSTLRVTVLATNTGGSASASSTPTAVVTVTAQAPANTGAPAVSGSATQGSTLTATNGTWTGSPSPTFTYAWQDCDSTGANCSAIGGATSSSYVLTGSNVGFTVEVVVTATNSAGSASATSAPTAVVTGSVQAPVNTALPAVVGSPVEGQTLSATNGTWTGSPSAFSYQWQDCNAAGTSCAAIGGATSATYMPGAADVGARVAVVVTATNGGGSTPASSAPTAAVTSASGPLTPLLDDFNRADNSGPPGPGWLSLPAFNSPSTNNLFISGQQVAALSVEAADYWSTPFGANSEDYVTIATKPTFNNDLVTLGLRYQSPGTTTSSGYQASFINISSGTDQYRIWLRTNGNSAATILKSVTGPELLAGDQILFRAIGTTLELWRGSKGTWTKLISVTDSTITGGGYAALIARDGQVRLDNFGGGTLP